MPQFDQLLIFRALRPDRLTAALAKFVGTTIGKKYTASQPYNLEKSFQGGWILWVGGWADSNGQVLGVLCMLPLGAV